MTSLYRRATPTQARILRIVEGAVKNACDAHPEMQYGKRFARSIAKRAAGTLTAQWPDVLAASTRQNGDASHLSSGQAHGRGHSSAAPDAGVRRPTPATQPGLRQERAGLHRLHCRLGALARQTRLAGLDDVHDEIVEILRDLSKLAVDYPIKRM